MLRQVASKDDAFTESILNAFGDVMCLRRQLMLNLELQTRHGMKSASGL